MRKLSTNAPHMVIENIVKRYGIHKALNGVGFEIREGEFVTILGPSGCGKSTLLRVLAGLEEIDEGRIIINNRDVTCEAPAKRNFGIVFQSYALFPNLSVEENIGYGLKHRSINGARVPKEEREKRIDEVLELVGLKEHKSKYPQHISGGQQQRVALARAIVLRPEFLLLDEPLSALDAKVRLKLRREIKHIQQHLGITTLMVTHDQEEALSMADRVIVMNNSVIEQIGTPEEIYEHPKTSFVADFVGTVNFLDSSLVIRPESLRLSKEHAEDPLMAKVMEIEFRGAFYRLGIASPKGNFTVDVAAHERDSLPLVEGADVFLTIPREKLIRLQNAS